MIETSISELETEEEWLQGLPVLKQLRTHLTETSLLNYTSGQNHATIDRPHIGVIASHHSRFDGDLDDAIAEACAEGYIEEVDDEYRATDRVWDVVPGATR